MTRTEIRLQNYKVAETRRRQERRLMKMERECSQTSGFILSFGEVLNTLLPAGICSCVSRAVVRRRLRRRTLA